MRPLTDPRSFEVRDADRELFARKLGAFVPPNVFDAHAHLYDFRAVAPPGTEYSDAKSPDGDTRVGYDVYARCQKSWMGNAAPAGGVFFAFPSRTLDVEAANDFLLREIKAHPDSRGLLMITPRCDPAMVERRVQNEGWSGFKVYHLFAARQDTHNSTIDEFLPEWAWQIAHERGLQIMLHMVLPRALADVRNQQYIRAHCEKYRNAKLVLAHAARGFCASHTVEGIKSLRGLENVFFDTSAICEPPAFEAIFKVFGATRLMYGSDFPVSEARGRALSLGDGFLWVYEEETSSGANGQYTLVGIESLFALQIACRNAHLNDGDVENIFSNNARSLLGIANASTRAVSTHTSGQELYREAKALMPGGTQLLSKRPEMFAPEVWPPYFREARGCEIVTLEGRHLIDFSTGGIGSCLLGFAHPAVVEAVQRRVLLGSMSTLNPPEEVELARVLLELHPWAHNARFARGGGEALSIAIRIARAATGRDVIALCGYHGWTDWYLAANLNQDDALVGHLIPGLLPAGVPRGLQGTALPFAYNDLDALQKIVREQSAGLAAVVMEPTRNSHPAPGFLEGVRDLCDQSGARLIFDEVTTGFRLHRGGAHLKYGVSPDMAVFAKALGNGHPVAAIIGQETTMQAAQESFISSTYWTESVGAAAALATLQVLASLDVPSHVEKIGMLARDGLARLAHKHALPLKISGHPCLTFLSFDHADGATLMTMFTIQMLERGFLAGSGFYPTLSHEPRHVEAFLQAADEVFAVLGEAAQSENVAQELSTPVRHAGFARLN